MSTPFSSPYSVSLISTSNSISAKLDVWSIFLDGDFDREFLLKGIEFGFRVTNVDSEIKNVELPNHPSAIKFSDLVEKELLHQIGLGNYVKSTVKPCIVSPLGAIPKEDGGVRIIHDGSRPLGSALNDYAMLSKVRFQTFDEALRLATPGSFLAKVDLKAAYRSVLINPCEYKMTGIKWCFTGDSSYTYLFDTRLPFGARLAPSCFHRLTQAVRRFMARQGFKNIIAYLDDFLIIEDSRERCAAGQMCLISLLIRLGFAISWAKVVGPCQSITFLGLIIDTNECVVTLESHKVDNLSNELLKFRSKNRASKRQLQSLAGKLNWACQAVRGGRFFLRRILDLIGGLRANNHKFKLTKDFNDDLCWWLDYIRVFNGKVYFRQGDTAVVHTDSCNVGAGVFFQGDWEYFNWSVDAPNYQSHHINYKEVMAIVLACHRWGESWCNRHVKVITDSTVACAIINKGTCKDPLVMMALRRLFWLQVTLNFSLSAIHIPGVLNEIPDCISRLHQPNQLRRLYLLLCNWYRRPIMLGEIGSHMSVLSFQSLRRIHPEIWHGSWNGLSPPTGLPLSQITRDERMHRN